MRRSFEALTPTSWTPAQVPDLRGRVALVTGANSGIGFQTTRKLAENGCKVYMVSRDLNNGKEAAASILSEIPNAQLEVLQCDMSLMSNVVRLAEQFNATGNPLHILVNNAGSFFPGKFAMTPDGFEQTLAINYFSHALLTLMLLDKLQPGSRVVMMSSEGEGPLSKYDASLSNFRGDKYRDSGLQPYGDAKLYAIMFARELSTRLRSRQVDVFAVQPGLVNTPGHNKMDRTNYLSSWYISGMGKLFGQTAYHGSWSTLFAATEPSLTGKGYAFYGPNWAGLFHSVERQPGNKAARNPVSCWAMFERTVETLSGIVGRDRLAPIPHHPNDPNALTSSARKVATAA